MDTAPQHTDTELQLTHLIAQNESLKAQLEEYLYIINMRDKEIETLRRRMAETTESMSTADNQLDELNSLQDHIHQLRQQAEGIAGREMDLEKQLGHAVSTEHQLDDMKEQYTYQQVQLSDLQTYLQELNARNVLLQQQASQIAELESSLEDAQRERDELKEQLAKGDEN
jgi:chromosome segregation ATPase